MGRLAEATTGQHPTRPGLPDRGEFGRFELALYLAYGWLGVGAILDILAGIQLALGFPLWADGDAHRHIYLAGFLATLLFGMEPRMIPGFIHARQVGVPGLVGPAVVVWTLTALLRIAPLLLEGSLNGWGVPAQVLAISFGVSGPLGTIAVGLLAVSLFKTRPLQAP